MPEDYKCIKTELFCKLREGCCPQRGDILLTRVGAGIGEAAIIDTDLEFAIYVSLTLIKLISNKDISNEYILYWLNSPVGIKNAADNTAGKGASQGNLNVKNVRYYYVAVPPIEEQKRIVCKLKELEPLIEKYNQTEIRLYELNSNIKEQLKKSILQYAIEGKLASQDPNDEPASVLLDRIHKEKQNLIAEGKIKKDKNESIIYRRDNSYYEKLGKSEKCINNQIPFEIPYNWMWNRWGNISFKIQYGYNARAKVKGKIKMVRISDIQDNKVIWENVPFCDIDDNEIEYYILHINDILFARTGGTVGKSFLVDNIEENAVFAGYLIRTVYDYINLNPKYLKYYMETNLYWSQLRKGTIATAQPNCNGQTLSSMFIPIPPLEEQKRIIEKINEITNLLEL